MPVPGAATCTDLKICLPDTEVATFRLTATAPAVGRTIGELALRKEHGLTVLAVRRGTEMLYNPEADTRLHAGDIIIAFGEPDRLATAATLFTELQPLPVLPSQ
ncbi:MAG: TrkA C-terminal domain-containing protein [Syntrophales bacterium]|nr:TrkA C-terminal domain-containing protein [Syntrophales bacterium]